MRNRPFVQLVVIAVIATAILFLGGMNGRWFAGLLVMMALGFAGLVLSSPYRMQRIFGFMDPWSDPFGRGWNLLGLAHFHVAYVLSTHPPVLAGIKVACVVTGHIVAVIAAHDKALRLLPAGHQLTGQLTMMLVMVGYTFTGLYLLFGG